MTNAPRTLMLHVGHGKTGSSYLQSALAASRGVLETAEIAYPMTEMQAKAAEGGAIRSGNLRYVPGALTEALSRVAPGARQVLFSSESLFPTLARMLPVFHAEAEAALPGVVLKVLLYIRDPLDHAVSSYHQEVKRGGYTGSLEDILTGYLLPAKVGTFLRQLREGGVAVTVRNYSRHSAALLSTFEDWVGVPAGTLIPPPVAQINRSLTLGEIALQKAFNEHFGKEARRYVSDPLCTGLPGLRSETPAVSELVLAAFLTRMQRMIAMRIDKAAIPEAEMYRIGTVAEHAGRFSKYDDPDHLVFSRAQLAIFAKALHAELVRVGAVGRKRDRLHKPPDGSV